MFVPRALLKKGVRPPAKPPAKPPAAPSKAEEQTANPQPLLPTRPATVQSSESTGPESIRQTGSQATGEEELSLRGKRKLDETSPTEETTVAPKKVKGDRSERGSNITKWEVTDAYLKEVVLGIEIFFSDYAHRDRTGWLKRFQKVIDGEPGYIHLSTLISSPLFERLKPQVTHNIIHQALQSFPSEYIEEAQDGLHIRRKPATYPLPFISDEEAAAMVEEEEGVNFWDSHTIYVEPDRSTMCIKPTSVASSLIKDGGLSPKLLPIQAVQTLHPSCALVVFSGTITHSSGERWLEKGLPKNWIVMSKQEHDRHTEEYEDLLDRETRIREESRLSEIGNKPLNNRQLMRAAKRRQAERRAAKLLEPKKPAPVQTIATGSTSVAFPERWTFVRLSNMPQKLALEAIFRLVKNISPRPIEAYLAFHTYGKLFVVLQFAMAEDAEAVVQAFNDKVKALKEKGELEKWLTGLNAGYERGSWDGLPDKAILKNPSQDDRKKLQKKKEKAKKEGTFARILDMEEAKACWEQLQRKTGITCTGAPPSE